MPYISKNDDRREALRNGEPALIAGELNYQIFYFIKHVFCCGFNNNDVEVKNTIKKFVDNFLGEKPNYQRYNDMTGCLVRCCVEIDRRLDIRAEVLLDIAQSYDDEIAKYEDKKIKENGDVE